MAEQRVMGESERGRIVAVDSAYGVSEDNRGRDVVVNASYAGVLPARFIARCAPRASIGVDCAMGLHGAGIAGLWYLEALGIGAAAADVGTVELGNGAAMFAEGRISVVNEPAASCGVVPGMGVAQAARLLLAADPRVRDADAVTNRTVVHTGVSGRQVVCTDSIAFAEPRDRGANVLCTGGHTGRSAVPYLRQAAPWAFICSDGGRGARDSGIAALEVVAAEGLAGATVDARTARMGDGRSTYYDGVISACNRVAHQRGVRVGQRAVEAAHLLCDAGR